MSGFSFLWRWGELNPRPNPSMKANLRRVVSVSFKAGCEERRRNHSYPIPYLDMLVGRSAIDFADDSAPTSDCKNSRSRDVA